MPPSAVGIDVGGTKLVGAVVNADGSISHRQRQLTPAAGGEAVIEAIVAVVRELWQAADSTLPVGVGIAGLIHEGVVTYAPNITNFNGVALAAQLHERLSCEVVIDNDANVAAWAEHLVGAGRGVGDLVMLTVGTGIGGGYVQGGRLLHGAHGMAAEFGHTIVLEAGPLCACGNRGCLEALASGQAIARTAEELLALDPMGSDLRGLEPLTGKAVTVAAQQGDELAVAALARCGFWLGVGAASIVNALDPAVVVFGGGAMQAGALLLEPAHAAYQERVVGAQRRAVPPLQLAALDDDAGLIGAGLLALAATS